MRATTGGNGAMDVSASHMEQEGSGSSEASQWSGTEGSRTHVSSWPLTGHFAKTSVTGAIGISLGASTDCPMSAHPSATPALRIPSKMRSR
jgi:hypothetical protein